MNKFFIKFKNICMFYLVLIFILLLVSIISYIFAFSDNLNRIILFIFSFILFVVLGIIHGYKSDLKKYLISLKLIIYNYLLLYFIGGLLFSFRITKIGIIYYCVLNLGIYCGVLIGRNKKELN